MTRVAGFVRARPWASFVAVAAVTAAVGFAVAFQTVVWLYAHHFYSASPPDADVGIFERYAGLIFRGQVPYQNFTMLYPPGAIPAFVLPGQMAGIRDDAAYLAAFQTLMLGCGAIAACLSVITLGRLTTRTSDVLVATTLLVASPLLLGQVMVTRYDLWPTALTAGAMLCVILARYPAAAVLLGAGVVTKVFPIVLVLFVAAYVWRHAGRWQSALFVALTLGTIGIVFAQFLLASSDGVIHAMTEAFDRQLQIETIGASLLVIVHGLNGLPLVPSVAGGSNNLIGALPGMAIAIQSIALGLLLLIAWVRFVRGPGDARSLVLAAAAAVCLYVGLGRVVSDQYVIWLIPVVAMVPGGSGRIAAVWLAIILAASNWIYPNAYPAYVERWDPGVAAVVLARVLAIAILGIFLAWRAGSRSRSA